MSNRSRNALLIAGSTVLAAALATQPHADEQESTRRPIGELPRPIVNTHHLMELFNQPLYEYLKEAMQEEPSDDEGWSTLQDRGLQAAEVMNLVAIRNGKGSQQANWSKHLQTAQQAGVQLTEAAKTKDWQKTKTAYQALIRNCNDCHQDVAPDHAPQIKP